jgi:hypothetical protein
MNTLTIQIDDFKSEVLESIEVAKHASLCILDILIFIYLTET